MFNRSTLSMAVACAITMPAYAQVTNTDNESDYKVVVKATRTDTSLQDTAASATVITDEDIEKQMVMDIDDLFRYTPGVSVNSDSRAGITDINVRGIDGNRVKITLDGVSQPLTFDSGGTFIQSSRLDVDLDIVKSVEVLKGAASSLSGSDALAGVVAFTTKDPRDFLSRDGDTSGGHVKLGYSSDSQAFTESVALANRTGNLESLIAYTHKTSEQVDNFGEPSPQDNSANNLLVKLQYQINDEHRLEFSGQYNKKDSETDLDATSSIYSPYAGHDTDEKTQIAIKHLWDLKSEFADDLSWQLAFIEKDKYANTSRTYLTSGTYTAGNEQEKRYTYSEKGFEGDIQFNKSLTQDSVSHEIAYGLSFATKKLENINNEYNSIDADKVVYYVPDASELKIGGFAQDQVFIDDWILTAGTRFDSYQTKTGDLISGSNLDASEYNDYSDSALTGRLAAMYHVNENHGIYAQVSQGFRAPTFSELYYSFGNSSAYYAYQSVPNPDLEAETSTSIESGWRYDNHEQSAELSVFYSKYKNFIDQQLISGSGTPADPSQYSYINIDSATIKGIELSHSMKLSALIDGAEQFSTHLAAGYTQGEDGDGEALDSISPWSANIGLGYDNVNGTWGSDITVSYTAEKSSSDVSSSNSSYLPPSATVIDLTAYYRPIEKLTLRAGIFNLTNQEHYNWNDLSENGSTDYQQYSQPKRYVSITAKYDF